MKNYENLCNRQKSEHGVMRREYESIKQWFYAKNDTEVKSEEEKMNQVNSLLRDKRMKIERGIRFTHLNKQHLVKNEKILKDEMETLTRELNKEQQKLNEERTIIQVKLCIASFLLREHSHKKTISFILDNIKNYKVLL